MAPPTANEVPDAVTMTTAARSSSAQEASMSSQAQVATASTSAEFAFPNLIKDSPKWPRLLTVATRRFRSGAHELELAVGAHSCAANRPQNCSLGSARSH
jgi:hypothetical protein